MDSKPSHDRRDSDRPPAPLCQVCQTQENVLATSRTTFVIYFRCSQCGNIAIVPKPKQSLIT